MMTSSNPCLSDPEADPNPEKRRLPFGSVSSIYSPQECVCVAESLARLSREEPRDSALIASKEV